MPVVTDKPCAPCEAARRSLYRKKREELDLLGIHLPQNDTEFEELCVKVGGRKPKVFVEVGTRDGGSLWMLSHFCAPGALIVSIDLPNMRWGRPGTQENRKKACDSISSTGRRVVCIDANSQAQSTRDELDKALEGKAVDLLFLDADHTFAGVLRDWELYHPTVGANGMVVFHDIYESPAAPKVNVHFLWRTLRTIYRSQEWGHEQSRIFGIGVVYK